MEYSSVRKMENVVEAVAVGIKNVVGERFTNKKLCSIEDNFVRSFAA